MRKTHKHETGRGMKMDMAHCIEQCLHCYRTCAETLQHCIETGGHHTEPNHLKLMADCKDICLTSANFMMRGSERHVLTCGVCADVCQQCGDDCEKMGDDKVMKACADVCHACADSCREMAQAHA